MNESNDTVLTVDEARDYLKVGKNTAYYLFAKDKSFPSFRIGKRHLILKSQLIRWIEKQGNKSKYGIRYS